MSVWGLFQTSYTRARQTLILFKILDVFLAVGDNVLFNTVEKYNELR